VDEVKLGLALGAKADLGAGIWVVQPGQDLDQGRLARAVLADQGDDLTAADLQ